MQNSDCCQFSDIHILQCSVATYLRCGGILKYEFVANLPVSLPVKEFWKSVSIWGSYGQEFSVLFFLRHSVHTYTCYVDGTLWIRGTVPAPLLFRPLSSHFPPFRSPISRPPPLSLPLRSRPPLRLRGSGEAHMLPQRILVDKSAPFWLLNDGSFPVFIVH